MFRFSLSLIRIGDSGQPDSIIIFNSGAFSLNLFYAAGDLYPLSENSFCSLCVYMSASSICGNYIWPGQLAPLANSTQLLSLYLAPLVKWFILAAAMCKLSCSVASIRSGFFFPLPCFHWGKEKGRPRCQIQDDTSGSFGVPAPQTNGKKALLKKEKAPFFKPEGVRQKKWEIIFFTFFSQLLWRKKRKNTGSKNNNQREQTLNKWWG